MNHYFTVGNWISFVYKYTGKGYIGEVKEVKEDARYGQSVLLMTENGYRRFYTIGIEDLMRHK